MSNTATGGRKIELWVGVLVLGGLLSLGFLAFEVGNFDNARVRDGYRVYADFQNIGGLTLRAPVAVAGVRIGQVTGITLSRDSFNARVELTIARRYDNLPVDSSASIFTKGLLGAQYVGLEPGSDEELLGDGGEIEFTNSSVVLEQLIGELLFSKAEEAAE